MEEILKYENRDRLYQFLIDDFELIKVGEMLDKANFGNFFIKLASKDFFLTYINDRSFLTIVISSKLEPEHQIDLSFVRDFIYDSEHINAHRKVDDNATRISSFNDFLRRDFAKISQLFRPENYFTTRSKIDHLLKEQFKKK